MFLTYLELINSSQVPTRIEGWRKLRADSAVLRPIVTRQFIDALLELLAEEEFETVQHEAHLALIALQNVPSEVSAPAPPQVSQASPAVDQSLLKWLWDPFARESIVLSTTSCDYRRRDEAAGIYLGRQLCHHQFSKTKFSQIPVYAESWQEKFIDSQYKAVCLLGRLGLYGECAVKNLAYPQGRFYFLTHKRPAGTTTELDEQFHCLVERTDPHKKEYYRTLEKDGVRTDYALVQRYTVRVNSRSIVVVLCAGASSLGTLAAARWATFDLGQSVDHRPRKLIPAPDKISSDSCLEALLEVRADVTTDAWNIKEIKPLKLFVDDKPWSFQQQAWQERNIRMITIIMGDKGAKEIQFDGKTPNLQNDKSYFKMLVALALQIKEDGKIDLVALGKNKSIWGGKQKSKTKVLESLRHLKTRYLKDALATSPAVMLLADIEFVEES